jgi:hypothetical protein
MAHPLEAAFGRLLFGAYRCRRTPETLALLKILALGNRQIEKGKVTPAAEAFRAVREKSARKP